MENEGINYSFTGDVSSLSGATSKAIDLLTSIKDKYEEVAKAGQLSGSKTSLNGYTSSLKAAFKRASELSATLQKIGDVKISPDSKQSDNLLKMLDALTEVNKYLTQLGEGSSLDSADMGIMAEFIRESSTAMAQLNTNAIATGASFGDLVKNLTTSGLDQAVTEIKDVLNIGPEIAQTMEGLGFDTVDSPFDDVSDSIKEIEVEWAKAEALMNSSEFAGISSGMSTAARSAEEAALWMEVWDKKLIEADGNVKKVAASMKELVDTQFASGSMDLRPALQQELAGDPKEQIFSWSAALDFFKSNLSDAASAFSKIGAAAAAVGSVVKKSIDIAMGPVDEMLGKLASKLKTFKTTFLRIIRGKVIRAILKDIGTAMNSLAQHSSSAATALSSLQTSAGYVTGSLVAALSPALSSIAALVDSVTSKVVALIEALNMLFARLSGATFFTRAVKTTKQFGGAVGGAAGAASDLKDQLLGIDELNVLKDEASGGGGGGGGGGGDFAFEDVPIPDNWLTDIAGQIRDAFEKGDFAEIGRILGTALNDAVLKAHDFIQWDKVGPGIVDTINKYVGAFNAFINTVDWWMVGNTIGDALTTLFSTTQAFIGTIDWSGLGAAVGNSLNGFFASEALKSFAGSISTFVKSILTFIREAIKSTDWTLVGIQLGIALANIDWAGAFMLAVDVIFEVIKALPGFILPLLAIILTEIGLFIVDTIIAFGNEIALILGVGDWYETNIAAPVRTYLEPARTLGETLGEEFASGVDHGTNTGLNGMDLSTTDAIVFQKLIDSGVIDETTRVGELASLGLAEGFLKDISQEDFDKMVKKYMIDPSKSALDINSPSKVYEQIGVDSIKGLHQGTTSEWPSITSFFESNLSGLATSISTAWDGIKTTASTGWGKIKEAITGKASEANTETSTKFSGMNTELGTTFAATQKTAEDSWGNIKKAIVDPTKETAEEVSKIFGGMESPIQTVWNNIGTAMKTAMGGMLLAAQTWINGIVLAINAMVSAVKEIAQSELGKKANVSTAGLRTYVAPGLPKLATGGIVTGATTAIIGEGKYDEAVIPLGNSPQMKELVKDIANAVSKEPSVVQVVIGGREWDTHVYQSSERGKRLVGARPVRIGGMA